MILKKVNKENLEIVFYKHIERVVEKYDNYIYQKEQLAFLSVAHELAVKHTINICDAIVKHEEAKNAKENFDNDNVITVGDTIVDSYGIYKNSARIMLKLKNSILVNEDINHKKEIIIEKTNNKYKLYVLYKGRNEGVRPMYYQNFQMYQLSLNSQDYIKEKVDEISANPVQIGNAFIVRSLHDIDLGQTNELFDISEIDKETHEGEYIKSILSDISKGKERLKDIINELTIKKDKSEYSYELNTKHGVNIIADSQNSHFILYHLIFDTRNILSIMYDYMLNNIDKYIDNIEKTKTIDKEYTSYESAETTVYLSKLRYDNHFKILYDILMLDVSTLYDYKKSRDIVFIFKRLFSNIRDNLFEVKEISQILNNITQGIGLSIIFDGYYINYLNNYIKPELTSRQLRNNLNALVDGEDSLFNLLGVIMFMDYKKNKHMKTMKLSNGTKVNVARMNTPSLQILAGNTKGQTCKHYKKSWGKKDIDNLSNLLDIR